MRDYRLYLKDILDTMGAIEKFVENMELDDFSSDDKTSSAVIKKFEIIGEATKNVPDEIRKKYPDIPWKEMAGLRDKLVHFYFGIKYEIVWETIKQRLPFLKSSIRKVLRDLEDAEKK